MDNDKVIAIEWKMRQGYAVFLPRPVCIGKIGIIRAREMSCVPEEP